MIFFLRPLFAGGGGDERPLALSEWRRIQEQRATATRPSTQIRAHKRAARITTKSESSSFGLDNELSESFVDELTSPRILVRRLMCGERECVPRIGSWKVQ